MSDNAMQIDDLLNSCKDEKRINIIKLTVHMAALTTEVKNQKSDIDELKDTMTDVSSIVNKMNNKLFVDNGETSIITNFKKKDDELEENQRQTNKRVFDVDKKIDILIDRKTVRDKFLKWIVPIMIGIIFSVIGTLVSLNIIRKSDAHKNSIIITGDLYDKANSGKNN